MVQRISSVQGNLFIFGLVCYICPGNQKINILTAEYKRISNDQAVYLFSSAGHIVPLLESLGPHFGLLAGLMWLACYVLTHIAKETLGNIGEFHMGTGS